MKQGWQIKKLGEICESRLGKTLNSTTDTGELRPYLCAVNVQWDRFDLSYVKEAPFENDEIEKFTAKKGDLLVCEGGETGRAAIWDKDEPIQYQNALHRVRFKDNTIIPRFCLHYLHFLKLSGVLDKEYSHGATILHLVTKSLYSIPIPIPTISEQQRIVSLLDAEFAKIDTLKANAERNLQNAKDLFQAALKKELEPKEGWEKTTLGELCECITKGTTPTSIGFSFTAEGVNFVKAESFTEDGDIVLEKVTHISTDCNVALRRSQLQKDDILFSIAGVLGRVAIVSEKILPANTNQALAIIRLKEKDYTFIRYLSLYFKSDIILKQIEKDKKGAAQLNLSLAQLNIMPVVFPPKDKLQNIVAILEALSEKCKALQENYTKTIALCDDLKQALLRKAFNGEI